MQFSTIQLHITPNLILTILINIKLQTRPIHTKKPITGYFKLKKMAWLQKCYFWKHLNDSLKWKQGQETSLGQSAL